MVRRALRFAWCVLHRPHLVEKQERAYVVEPGRGEGTVDEEARAFECGDCFHRAGGGPLVS